MEPIGNLGGGSITDMLPDQLMISPSVSGYHKKRIGMNLHTCTCAACGKKFEAHSGHKYKTERKLNGSQKVRMYCSWHCFSPVEKAMAEKFKADCLGFVAVSGRDKSVLERARIRLEKCKRKMAEYRAIRNDPAKWSVLDQKKRWAVTANCNQWKKKLAEAEEALAQLEQMEREGI